jgi:hypothetical protein
MTGVFRLFCSIFVCFVFLASPQGRCLLLKYSLINKKKAAGDHYQVGALIFRMRGNVLMLPIIIVVLPWQERETREICKT